MKSELLKALKETLAKNNIRLYYTRHTDQATYFSKDLITGEVRIVTNPNTSLPEMYLDIVEAIWAILEARKAPTSLWGDYKYGADRSVANG